MSLSPPPANQIERNAVGRWMPMVLVCLSMGLMVAAAVMSNEASRQGIAAALGCISLLTAAASGALEIDIRREVRLANVGIIVEANVVEVCLRRTRQGDDYGWMRYYFTTVDGQEIEKKCRLTFNQTAYITVGSRLQIIYDPAKPRRNRPVENMRMVELDALLS